MSNLFEDMSIERNEYIKKERRWKRLVSICRLACLLAFFLIWELAANMRWIDSFITSQPSRVLKTIINLHNNGSLYMHIWVTLKETLIALGLGASGGLIIAIGLWWSRFFYEFSEPYLVVLNALPKVALGPLLIVWLGNGASAIIGMALLISIIVTIITISSGFQEVDSDKIKLLRAFGANKYQILTKVVLPGSLPAIISALKVSVGLSLVGVIMGEFLVSQAGLGYLIVYGRQVFKLDLVMSSIIILAITAALMYIIVSVLERKVLKWQKLNM